ncbi:ATP-grasp domain-containing protein [Patescibacteria group bacterium]|nr:ATP-grasp domain-containing protein [Patescibacteria group bacterium]MBU1938897.1 ATP-grasp domain-containing protein [Patescibacteria group bacterium]
MKAASFELLEFLLSPSRHKYHVINLSGSPAEAVTKASYPAKRIITPTILTRKTPEELEEFVHRAGEKDILQQTSLGKLIRRHGIQAICPDTYSTPFLERWAKRNKIQVICTPYRFQKKYENKIFFDRFLRRLKLPVPPGRILRSVYDAYRVNSFPVVLQTPVSAGSIGTFVVRDWEELLRLTSVEKRVDFPLLCREFISDAHPLGVSILIGPKKMAFSALRMQAYFTQAGGKSTYYGIQWIKTSSIKPKTIRKLNTALYKAGKAMQKDGYRGIAAFDVMVRDNDIFFIECNPRTGGSSPHLANRPELLHGLSFTDEYVRILTGDELSADKPFIPNSDYEGFTLDLSFLSDLLPIGLPLNHLCYGVYRYQNGQLHYHSAKADDFNESGNVFVHFVRPEGALLNPHIFTGFVFTHFPLLKIHGMEYTFIKEAQKLLHHLEDIVIKK